MGNTDVRVTVLGCSRQKIPLTLTFCSRCYGRLGRWNQTTMLITCVLAHVNQVFDRSAMSGGVTACRQREQHGGKFSGLFRINSPSSRQRNMTDHLSAITGTETTFRLNRIVSVKIHHISSKKCSIQNTKNALILFSEVGTLNWFASAGSLHSDEKFRLCCKAGNSAQSH